MKPFLLFFFTLILHMARAQEPKGVESIIETVNAQTGKRTIIYTEKRHIEAPNWSPDGTYLIVNSGGLLYKLLLANRL